MRKQIEKYIKEVVKPIAKNDIYSYANRFADPNAETVVDQSEQSDSGNIFANIETNFREVRDAIDAF